jgi:hypothetical protein
MRSPPGLTKDGVLTRFVRGAHPIIFHFVELMRMRDMINTYVLSDQRMKCDDGGILRSANGPRSSEGGHQERPRERTLSLPLHASDALADAIPEGSLCSGFGRALCYRSYAGSVQFLPLFFAL